MRNTLKSRSLFIAILIDFVAGLAMVPKPFLKAPAPFPDTLQLTGADATLPYPIYSKW